MLRNYSFLWILPLFFCNSAGAAPSHVERGNLIFDNIPEAPVELSAKVDAALSGRDATPLGWSPKGELLISTRFGEVAQLHLVEKAEGARRQMTFLQDPIGEAAFSPDPVRRGYFYLKDVGGNENRQLYYQRLGEPAAKLLTDGKSVNGAAVWSNTGKEIAFSSTARDGINHDIYIVDPESGTLPHLAVSGDAANWIPLDWSPDDRKLLVLKTVSAGEAYLYAVDLSSGQKHEVEPAPGKVGIAGAKFSRDGTGVYLISDRDGEFGKLHYVNLFTADKSVISEHLSGDVEEVAISRDGHYLAYSSNEGGTSKLNVVDLKARQDLTPPRLPAPGLIDHLRFDADGKRLAFGYQTATLPRVAYVLEVATNRLEPWTHSEPGAVDAAKFLSPRLMQFPSFDRPDGHPREIPAYVYEPSKPGPHPVLVLFHGGPESQYRPGFDPWVQFVVNELGFAVVAPNLRGSSGYGKSYQALDNAMQRDDVVKDLGALIVGLGLQSNFDAKHVVVAGDCCSSGDSYGGYLALAALTNYGDRLIGAVDPAGMGDLISFLGTTAPYRQSARRAEYGDEHDPDTRAYLRRISPLTNADRVAKPVLVIQGKNDARTPAGESEQIVNRLRSRGIEVWYLQAKDEGHEFARQQNRLVYYRTFAAFLTSLH